MRRFTAALALAALLTPRVTRGEEGVVFEAPRPAPAKAADLTWRFDGKLTPGVFLTADQEVVVGNRVLTCQKGLDLTLDKAAACEVALIKARGEVKVEGVRWYWWLAGGVAAGVAGAYAAQALRK